MKFILEIQKMSSKKSKQKWLLIHLIQ